MTVQASISGEINGRAEGSYESWHIGITQDPDATKTFWKDSRGESIDMWMDWETESADTARDVRDRFTALGMMAAPEEELAADQRTYVYVF